MTDEIIIGETAVSSMMEQLVELFGVIYTSGIFLWNWLSTPIVESADGEALSFLGELATYTPFELIFGLGIFVILIYQLVKFVVGI